jgi:hypothetical protein
MKILFTGKNHSQGLKDLDSSSLAGAAKALGFESVVSVEDNPDVVICVDFHKSALSVIREAKSNGIKTVLVVNEPEVVIPQHAQLRIRKEFDKVIEVGRAWAEPSLTWPQTWLPVASNLERFDRVVLVNADKWSFVQGQHYWLRAAAASKIKTVDVFGFGWERSLAVRLAHRIFELWRTVASKTVPSFQGTNYLFATPSSYMGSASNKNTAMKNYKVALVVENSSEFLTEKLFDAWFAGCIPVYVGASLKSLGLRDDLAIECEPTLQSVESGIKAALKEDLGRFHKNLVDYLANPAMKERWGAKESLKAILEAAI